MILRAIWGVLIVGLLVVSVSAQRTWIVECSGRDYADFTDLPAAVAAASPGDTILVVRDTSYSCPGWQGYTATNIDKPIRIVGVAQSGGWYGSANVKGRLTISDIPPGQQLVLCHLYITGVGGFIATGPPFGIVAQDCGGDIILEDCSVDSQGGGGATMQFTNCANIVLRGSLAVMGGEPMRVTDSSLMLSNSLVRHTGPFYTLSGQPTFPQTAEGIRLTNSTATLLTSTVEGSGEVGLFPYSLWTARVAVTLENSTVQVGPASLIIGGPHFGGGNTASYFYHGGGGGTVCIDPRGRIDLLPGFSSGPVPTPKYLHATMHNYANGNAALDLVVAGPPGGYAVLAVGDYSSPPEPTPFGPLWLGQQSIAIVACNPLDAIDGNWFGTLFVPSGVPVGHPFCLQAMLLAPDGTFSLTIPSPLVVGWQAGLPPN